MKQTRNLLLTGAIVLVAGVFSACGGGNSAEAEAAAMPTDGILGELPKVVAEYEAAETAASAKYDEMKKSNPDKAREFWTEYINQGNTTKFKKETLPAVEKTLEGKEIPTEVAEELPLKLETNFTLNDGIELAADESAGMELLVAAVPLRQPADTRHELYTRSLRRRRQCHCHRQEH